MVEVINWVSNAITRVFKRVVTVETRVAIATETNRFANLVTDFSVGITLFS